MKAAAGFTLVEVLVALVVLQVGLLGVVGTLLLASRTLGRAEVVEWAVAEVQRAADSLAGTEPGGGRAASGPGELVWEVDGGGRIIVAYRLHGDTLAAAEGVARAQGGEDGGG